MMRVDIFSDVRCPFCYVGKKKFEKALEEFSAKEKIEINWHSFQLDPSLKTDPSIDPFEFFSRAKGISVKEAKLMHEHARNAGKEAGIEFNFENQKVANSYRAHLLIQLAKKKNLANEMEEALFEAQFLHGKNIDSEEDLIEIGEKVGLSKEEVLEALASDDLAYGIKEDEQLARQIGVRAVPFFVFNDKYGVSGAQHPSTFLGALEKSYSEFKQGDQGLKIISEGESCSTDGECS